MRIEAPITQKLLTTVCLFVVTTIAIVSFIAPTIFGQEQNTAKVNPSLAESVTDRVDKLFAQWDKPGSPGCALGIVKDGQLIYKRGYGMANLDYNIPISSKSVFQVASTSKPFTAISILLLAKRGKLSLDDEIQKYLPEVHRYQSPITIRHLIYHTSGIRNYIALAALAGMRFTDVHLTDDDYFGLIARQKELNHQPGEEYLYSNSGYILLGLIVKRVSGESLGAFADGHIFKPLGMTNTHFHDDRNSVVRNRVTGYNPRSNGDFSAVPMYARPMGDGGLYTTVEDLFLWDQNFNSNKLGGGAALIRDQVSLGMLNNGQKINYALGLEVGEYKGLKVIGHEGSTSGFGSRFMRFAEEHFSVICLCNLYNINTDGLAKRVADIFLADQFRKSAGEVNDTVAAASDIISIPEKGLASLTGLYFDPVRDTTLRFYMKDGRLMIDRGAGYVLSPLSQNRFKVVGAAVEIVFVRPLAGGPMQATVISGGKTTTYDAVQSVPPTSAQLAEFTGQYRSDELPGAIYTLSIKDGTLLLQVRNGITVFSERAMVMGYGAAGASETPKDILLTPAFADAFVTILAGEVMVRFMRNQQNAVSGFTLSTEEVRRLRFNKL